MGSGSTLVAASMLGRRFVGYDLDAQYVELARARVAEEGAPIAEDTDGRSSGARCLEALRDAGFVIEATDKRVAKTAVSVDALARDQAGALWHVEFGGPATAHRPGLSRPEVVFRSLGRLSALRGRLGAHAPLLLLTTAGPPPGSEADVALRAGGSALVTDVIDVTDPLDRSRLDAYAAGKPWPQAGFWRDEDLR
jgi:DNA methylase